MIPIYSDDWFALTSSGLHYLGTFKDYDDAESFAEEIYGEIIWIIAGEEARQWKKTLTWLGKI
jgi:hypothetical protein